MSCNGFSMHTHLQQAIRHCDYTASTPIQQAIPPILARRDLLGRAQAGSDKPQPALDEFEDGAFNVLAATDFAMRGIAVTAISNAVNYDMPDTAEASIHRTGRTGRASLTGETLTFPTPAGGRMVRVIGLILDEKMTRPTAAKIPFTRQWTFENPAEMKRSGTAKSPRAQRDSLRTDPGEIVPLYQAVSVFSDVRKDLYEQ